MLNLVQYLRLGRTLIHGVAMNGNLLRMQPKIASLGAFDAESVRLASQTMRSVREVDPETSSG